MEQLQTCWAAQVDRTCPLSEYPRPQLRRDSYLCLNGVWEYTVGERRGTILVPFSPETQLSGAGFVLRPGETLRCERRFTLPEGFGRGRVLLHFGAVDQAAEVYVNGKPAGSHEGGYLAFTMDVTAFLRDGENVLTVCVRDDTEEKPYARGKQLLNKPRGRMSYLFYSAQSGIWKTVWLESVPECYVKALRITPQPERKQVRFELEAEGRADGMTLVIRDGGRELWRYQGAAQASVCAELADFECWSPEHPKLYDVELRYGDDAAVSYFGMRSLSVEKDARGVLRLCLNGSPYFFNGVLDQGYWPESLMTPPADAALVHDLMQLKSMGYNTVRKHIKVEDERFYYHCDRLGLIVWQDMPCGGGRCNLPFVTYLPNILPWTARVLPDRPGFLFGRRGQAGREQFREELRSMVRQLYSHPCIALWTPFNEGWGQFDTHQISAAIRAEDATRFINEACGWYDQHGGDLYSIHNYFRSLKVRPQKDRVVALTEYGGYALETPGHTACPKKVGYKSYADAEKMMADYEKLWTDQLIPAMKQGLSAAIYTQLSDIEEEINGLMTYDRAVTKFDPARMQAIHARAQAAFEAAILPD